ncbi:MAG TPA: ferrochelatase [bacterium]|nr:ferrochelatase [bacterium]
MTYNSREKIGVVLFQLGGPDSYDAVEPFLHNLFLDPFIIDIPLGFLLRKPLAKFISKRRSIGVVEDYQTIGQPSPIRDITDRQSNLLEDELNKMDPGREYHTCVAMRYWHPLTEEAVDEIRQIDPDRLILLPLYPHYSRTTTGSSLYEWEQQIKDTSVTEIPSQLIESYHTYTPYINSVVDHVESTIESCCDSQEELHLLFSAHGVPLKVIKNGDPYQQHIERSVQLVMEGLSTTYPHHLSYQSKVGPQKWLEPATIDILQRLGSEGVNHLLVVPIAFVSDHLETLYELNIEDREIAEHAGISNYHVMKALNDSSLFIQALAQRVMEEVHHE